MRPIELIYKLMAMFPNSFINRRDELILIPKYNLYFRLEDVNSELDFKCKVIAWLSRPAIKFQGHEEGKSNYDELGGEYTYTKNYYGIRKNKEVRKQCLNAVNTILGTQFDSVQMEQIYCRLGNDINRNLTVDFIESNYDLKFVKERKDDLNEQKRIERQV